MYWMLRFVFASAIWMAGLKLSNCAATKNIRTGDGKVETMDKISYTFPARGEFIYLQNENIEIQVRTDYPSPENHASSVIKAVAIKFLGTTVEIYYEQTGATLQIYINGTLQCMHPRPCSDVRWIINDTTHEAIIINAKEANPLSQMFVKRQSANETNDGAISLELVESHPGNYSSFTGMIGGLNNTKLQLGNGSFIVYDNTTVTPRTLYQFAASWRIKDDSASLFNYYIKGGNYTVYNEPVENPVFLEDLVHNLTAMFNFDKTHPHNDTEIAQFNTTCEAREACLLAIARTNSLQAGLDELKHIHNEEYAQRKKENIPPQFLPTFPDTINISLSTNNTFVLDLKEYVRDNNTNDVSSLTYIIQESTIDSSQYTLDKGVFTWKFSEAILRNMTENKEDGDNSFKLSFKVLDEFKAQAVTSNIKLTFCACENSSQCDYSHIPEEGALHTVPCECDKYSQGDFCEIAVPPCNVTVCYEPDKCNNSVLKGSSPCASCPAGYEGDGITCNDIDECENSTDPVCGQFCKNTIGSYICSCDTEHYTLNEDKHTCDDIDECARDSSICNTQSHSECENTVGGYDCLCLEGYVLKNNTCTSETDAGRYEYYSTANLQVSIPNVDTLNSTQKAQVKDGVKVMLEGLFTKGNGAFSFVTITSIVYTSPDGKSHEIAKRAADIKSTGLKVEYSLRSDKKMNETTVSHQIKELVDTNQHNINASFNISGTPVTLTPSSKNFDIIPDKESPICEDKVKVRCQEETTTCEGYLGSYRCICKHGYAKSSSPYACSDIDECSWSNITDMCYRGNCSNRAGGWNCLCPDKVYNNPKKFGNDSFRCEGNFEYFGVVNFTWIPLTGQTFNKSIMTTFVTNKINTIFNSSTSRDSATNLTMQEMFREVTIYNTSYKETIPNLIYNVEVFFVITVGESMTSESLFNIVNNSIEKNSTTGIQAGVIKYIETKMFLDAQMSMCNASGHSKCSLESTSCLGENGTYSCPCKEGFQRTASDSQYTCSDINECDKEPMHICTSGGTCRNTFGNWTCSCPYGYEVIRVNDTEITCKDIDECSLNTKYVCNGGKCTNTEGNWSCNCSPGFSKDHIGEEIYQCKDINECDNWSNISQLCMKGSCVNTLGSWNCTCPDKAYGNLVNNNNGSFFCNDTDECAAKDKFTCTGPENSTICHNMLGTWDCQCKPGFTPNNITDDNRQCKDIDECKKAECGHGTCINTVGGWDCVCPVGYDKISDQNKTCTDVNECLKYNSIACINADECQNTQGGWECACEGRLKLKVINETSKLCRGVLEFYGKLELILAPYGSQQLDEEDLKNTLKNRLRDIFRESLEDKLVDVEIVSIKPKSSNRKRSAEPKTWDVDYIIHTEQNVSNAQIKNATAPIIADFRHHPINTSSVFVVWLDVPEVNLSDICNVRNVCNTSVSTCTSENGTLQCECFVGYIQTSGNMCKDVDECKQNTHNCSDGSTCLNTRGGFTCDCPNGKKYIDEECKDPCSDSKCKNNAACTHAGNDAGYTCSCDGGWTGLYCDSEIKHEETEKIDSSLQTIAIATGTSLGALVLFLSVVVVIVCRLRSEKAKEAEQLRMAESSSFHNGFDGPFLHQAYLYDGSNRVTGNGLEIPANGTVIPRARSNGSLNDFTRHNPIYAQPHKNRHLESPNTGDRNERHFAPGHHRSSSIPRYHATEPLPDYNRGHSDRLNMSHDSGLLTGSTTNGSLDRNRYRRRGSSDLQYGSLDRDLSRQRDIRL